MGIEHRSPVRLIGACRTGLLLLCAVLVALFLSASLRVTQGQPVAPLDDSYIHFQYARSLAEGHLGSYNVQDAPTSGGTSLLYPLLLAIGFWLGFTGPNIVWWAWLLGTVAYVILVQSAFELVRSLAGTVRFHRLSPTGATYLAALAAGAVTLNGAVMWSVLSGMETTLMAALAIGTFAVLSARRHSLASLLAILSALTRPEGGLLAVLVALWLLVDTIRSPMTPLTVRTGAVAALTAASIMVQPLLNLALTGSATATGLVAKSWLYNVPFYPLDIARSIFDSYSQIWLNMTTDLQVRIAPPLLAVAGLAYFIYDALRAWQQHRTIALSAIAVIWVLLGLMGIAMLQTATWHYARYQLAFIALLVIGGVCGAGLLLQNMPVLPRVALGVVTLVIFGGGTLATLGYAYASFVDSTYVTKSQPVAMSQWLHDNTPPDTRIGVHDTGAIRYLSERYTYDIIGLTTPGAALAWRNGPGTVYEQMERTPNRPDWFAVYPDLQVFAYLQGTNLFARVQAMFMRPAIGTEQLVSPGEQRIYEANWSLLNSGDSMYQADVIARLRGLHLVDAVDVADLASEQQHNYRWWNVAQVPGFATEVKQLPYRAPPEIIVMDGGRLLTGGEEMTVHTRPGEDMWVVMRTLPQNGTRLRVSVDGAPVGTWVYPQLAGYWLETVFHVPGSFIKSQRTIMRLEPVTTDLGFRQHAPYYHWFYQGTSTYIPPVPQHVVSAILGDRIQLLGYDLYTSTLQPGQTFSLTLYWQATQPIQESYKVFIHLATSSGQILAQSDGLPTFDTRTTDTWQTGEVIVDERQISLTPEQPTGEYRLISGMYRTATPNERLLIAGQSSDSVLLTTLEITPLQAHP